MKTRREDGVLLLLLLLLIRQAADDGGFTSPTRGTATGFQYLGRRRRVVPRRERWQVKNRR